MPKTLLRKARRDDDDDDLFEGDSLGFCWIYCLSAWNRAWMDDSSCLPVLSGTLENAKDTPTESLLDLLPVGMEQGTDG